MIPASGETWYWQGTSSSGTSTTSPTSATYAVSSSNHIMYVQDNSSLCWSALSGSVYDTIKATPAITTNPSSTSVTVSTNPTFTVVASNAALISGKLMMSVS
jgi:hypothetical protein